MNKAEVTEIKKQLSPDRCTIDRICGCYVNYEKKKIFTSAQAFGTVPDEEMYKYLDAFRHVLSGARGKNLIDLEFPLEQEQHGGTQDFLLRLRDSQLQDDVLLEMFYDKIIDYYENGENYYIILVHATYDVPGIALDGLEMDDASDNVYEHILCAICPVVLSKAALGYNEKKNLIEDRFRDWIVDAPVKGFLFPAFHDRTADIHSLLYFTKKAEDVQPDFVEAVFGAYPPMSAPEQREGFQDLVRGVIGEDGDYETMQSLHETLHQKIEEHDDAVAPLTLEKKDVKQLLSDAGVDKERLRGFDKRFEQSYHREDYPLLATNLMGGSKFELKSPDVIVRVNPERADLVETRVIDGRQCLVIKIDDRVEVNGVNVRTLPAR